MSNAVVAAAMAVACLAASCTPAGDPPSPGGALGVARAAVVGQCAPGETSLVVQRASGGGVADVGLFSTSPDTNQGSIGSIFSGVTKRGNPGESLLRFDLSGVPSGATVASATVTLSGAALCAPGPATVDVHRVLGPWDESTVTWNNFSSGFDPSPASSFQSAAGTDSFDVTGLAQQWVSGVYPNDGMLIEQATSCTYYNSSEAADPTSGPVLSLCYTAPTGPCAGQPDGAACATGVPCATGACFGGNCKIVAPGCPSGQVCNATGVCVPAGCPAGQVQCGNACVDVTSDPNNCGKCGFVCGVGLTCQGGACTGSCAPPQVQCPGGCADTTSDPNNCGACGNRCSPGATCANGACSQACGQSGQPCCPGGVCAAGNACDPGGFCAAVGGGCSPANCPPPNVCDGNVCNAPCAAPTVRCASGCTDVTADANNCGACGNVCSPGLLCAGGQCTTGSCVPLTCAQLGYQCGQASDGCGNFLQCGDCPAGLGCGDGGKPFFCGSPAGPPCTPLTCAQQGIQCGFAGDGCGNGLQCGGCPAGQTCGGGGQHYVCGGGGAGCTPSTCPPPSVCNGDVCTPPCPAPTVMCSGRCVDFTSDPSNCGACGNLCPGGATCVNGACSQACEPAGASCGSNAQCCSGVCDAAHGACFATGCGQPGQPCCPGGACATGASCDPNGNCKVAGACTPATCPPPNVCNGNVCTSPCPAGTVMCASGCVNPASDPNNCGACGNACFPGAACVAGQCTGGGSGTSTGSSSGGPTCVPLTCAQQGIQCGPAGDGCGGTIDCGGCVGGTCGGGGKPFLCGAGGPVCTPLTCAQQGIQCGPAGDGCGGTLQCGSCNAPAFCGGGGQPFVCGGGGTGCTPATCPPPGICGGGVCIPPCSASNCPPPNVCNGSVCEMPTCTPSTCPAPNVCNGDVCTSPCNPSSCPAPNVCNGGVCTAPACTPKHCGPGPGGIQCGVADNGCGTQVNCGGCPGGVACDANNECLICAIPNGPQECQAFGGTCVGAACSFCGQIGSACCPGGTCNAGAVCGAGNTCVSTCAPPGILCGGVCVNGTSDPNNCGGCGIACSSGFTCVNGACIGGSCTPAQIQACVTAGMTCVGGVCQGGCGQVGQPCCPSGCGAGATCGATGVCTATNNTCVPKTCAQQNITCGPAGDGCGGTLDCGGCAAPETCGGSGIPGVCGAPASGCSAGQGAGSSQPPYPSCENTPDPCSDFPGAVVASCTDLPQGYQATCCPVQCVTNSECPAGAICSGGECVPGKQSCVPLTCAELGDDCGLVADGCGGTIDCGACTAPETCGGGGTPNVCGAGNGMACAGDGGISDMPPYPTCETSPLCATYPGTYVASCTDTPNGYVAACCPLGCAEDKDCASGFICRSGQCAAPPPGCVPQLNACAQSGLQCGTAGDACGGTLICGSCTAPEICGGGGVPGVCGTTATVAPGACGGGAPPLQVGIAGASCQSILAASPGAPSGVYTLDPDGAGPNAPFPAYCDMTTDGGGWTLMATLHTTPDFVTSNTSAYWAGAWSDDWFASTHGDPTDPSACWVNRDARLFKPLVGPATILRATTPANGVARYHFGFQPSDWDLWNASRYVGGVNVIGPFDLPNVQVSTSLALTSPMPANCNGHWYNGGFYLGTVVNGADSDDGSQSRFATNSNQGPTFGYAGNQQVDARWSLWVR